MGGWNGLDLVNDFSTELGDVSGGFKTKVLRWINDGLREIATSHQWPFLKEKGQSVLLADKEAHYICLSKPTAPTVELIAGGTLSLLTIYKTLVTFYEERSGVESIAGIESAGLTPVGADLSIRLSDIPVSTSPLVTNRKVYISKGAGAFQYYGMVPNNVATLEEPSLDGNGDPIRDVDGNPVMIDVPVIFDIVSDSTSPITPPDENAIHMVDGDFYIDGNRVISGTSLQDLIFSSNGVNPTGTPDTWAPINQEEIQVYPKPTSDTVVSFFYYKLPSQVFGIRASVPQLPSWLFDNLRDYVLWRGYEFRDRAGKESKKLNYEQGLRLAISRKGKAIKRSGRVRCVTPDSDGYGI